MATGSGRFAATAATPGPSRPTISRAAAANYYEITAGLNYKPTNCITIRPEVRYDWRSMDDTAANAGVGGAFDNRAANEQFTFGIDFYLKF